VNNKIKNQTPIPVPSDSEVQYNSHSLISELLWQNKNKMKQTNKKKQGFFSTATK
jgi:hypothetical protein